MERKQRLKFTVEIPEEELRWLSSESTEFLREAIPDAVDANVTIQIDERPLFATPDGVARSITIPILLFLLDLAPAVNRLKRGETSEERVSLTSTLYAFRMRRLGSDVEFEVYEHDRRTSTLIASTHLSLDELVAEFCSVTEATLAAVLTSNPRLKEYVELATLREVSAALADD
jgi:hypothetical protein